MAVLTEFKEFLTEYKVVGLAVGFIMAAATTALVTSLVADIIMPILNPILSSTGNWKTMIVSLGPVNLLIGDFISAVINFLIMAFVVFIIAKWALKEEKVTKK